MFGIGLASTPSFIPFALAAVASLRRHNVDVPVTVYVDRPTGDLHRLAPVLNVAVDHVDTSADGFWSHSPADREWRSSRLVKIQSFLRAERDPYLYLDADTILLGDIGEIEADLADRLGSTADLFMLLNRPVAPTLWEHRHLYFRDPDIDRETAARLVNETYDLRLPVCFLDEATCWNSGVVYGTASVLRPLATRWLALYRRMLAASTRSRLIPRDQLSLWIAVWELRSTLRVVELPRRWNFMAGHLLGLPPGTADVDPAGLDGVRVLHLAQNKFDPWAMRHVAGALDGLGVAAPLPTTAIYAAGPRDSTESVQAYGMQREICLRAGLDADGNPREAPLDPVGATFRITGPFSLPRLAHAIELVTERADVLRGRLCRTGAGFAFVKEAGPPEIPVVTVDLRGRPAHDQQRRMAYLFLRSTDLLHDMQDGSPGLFVCAVLADDDHVVYARFSHTYFDQQAMYAFLRRLGRVYARLADGDDPAPELAAWQAADFFRYARQAEADVAGRRVAEEFWRPLVRDSVCELPLPDRSWRPWRERRSTGRLSWVMPEEDVRALGEARRVTGASQMLVLLGALSVVLAGATRTDFVPLTYNRHGQENTEPLIGPLWDTLITVPPGPSDAGLAGWVTAFAAANTAVPPMRGLALVDFASLDKVMELRRFNVNVLLPGRPLFFGRQRARPYVPTDGVSDPIASIKKVPTNVGIRLFALGSGRFRATGHYDPDDFADRERIFTALCHVLRRVVNRPRMSVDQARSEALRVLRGERVR